MIELVVAITIIGMAALVVAPAFKPQIEDARSVDEAVESLVRDVRQMALQKASMVELVVDVASCRYEVQIATDTVVRGSIAECLPGAWRNRPMLYRMLPTGAAYTSSHAHAWGVNVDRWTSRIEASHDE